MSKQGAIQMFNDLVDSYYFLSRRKDKSSNDGDNQTLEVRMKGLKSQFLNEMESIHEETVWRPLHMDYIKNKPIYAVQLKGTTTIKLLDANEYKQGVLEGWIKEVGN